MSCERALELPQLQDRFRINAIMASFQLGTNGTSWAGQARHGAQRTRSLTIRPAAGTDAVLDKPAWTGDGWPSKVANFLITNPVLFKVIKELARYEIRSTGLKRGVYWDQYVSDLEAQLPQLEAIKAELERPLQYPDYYMVPFHAYDSGNLSWKAAFECGPASQIMAIRTFKTETQLLPQEALAKLRHGITDHYKDYLALHQLPSPATIVDLGCSVGVSTRWLAEQFPAAQVTGLDLSPYFLAVAELQERQKPAGEKRITYRHALIEDNGLAPNSVDLLSFQFVIHECPGPVIASFIREARRVLKPGGCLMLVDNNPKSKTIQNLPPALFTLMKSTEPHTDSYYSFDVEGCMREEGFKHVVTKEADHRHRAVLGVAP